MKKTAILLLTVLLPVLVFVSVARAGFEISVKGGADVVGNVSSSKGQFAAYPSGIGFNISAEMMQSVIGDVLRIGAGAKVSHAAFTGSASPLKYNESITIVPIYALVQVNPLTNSGLFFRGHLGSNVVNDTGFKLRDTWGQEYQEYRFRNGGLYYALGVGYEFKEGIVMGVLYEGYSWRYYYYADNQDSLRLSKLSFSVGYKFNLNLKIVSE